MVLRVCLLLVTSAALALAQGVDIEQLFSDTFVVDSEGTYYKRTDNAGRDSEAFTTFEGAHDFGKLKEYCGRNLTVMNVPGERSLDAQMAHFADGSYQNASVVKTFSDIAALRSSGKFGVLFYVQTWDPLGGSVDKIAQWHSKGLRILKFAYGRGHNPAKEDVLGYGSGEKGGLTPLGQKVVAEMNRLQMIIDVAHANDETTIAACRASKARVVATHANCRAVTRVDRNKSYEALKAIAKTSGVFGVTASAG